MNAGAQLTFPFIQSQSMCAAIKNSQEWGIYISDFSGVQSLCRASAHLSGVGHEDRVQL